MLVSFIPPASIRFSLILGNDFARPVADRIGTFAKHIAAAEAGLAFMPAMLDINEAASLVFRQQDLQTDDPVRSMFLESAADIGDDL